MVQKKPIIFSVLLTVFLALSFTASAVVFPALAQSNADTSNCSVVSPLDGSCGFVVSPPSWAASFPQVDHPISYFSNGTYGIVWINSTTFNVIESQQISGVTYPAACIVTLPSGTTVLSQTSNQMTAILPNHVTAEIAIPSYSFCSKAGSSSSSPQTTTSPATSLYNFYDHALWDDGPYGNQVWQLYEYSHTPGTPNRYNCGSTCSPPHFGFESFIYDFIGTNNQVGGEIVTKATCSSGYCSFSWQMMGYYVYNGVMVTSSGYLTHPGDTLFNNPFEDGGSNPLVCGVAWDETHAVEQEICGYMNGESNLYSIDFQYDGGYYTCSNYPTSNFTYNQVYALDQNSNLIYFGGYLVSSAGTCGPPIGGGNWACDLVTPTYGTTVQVAFTYDTHASGTCAGP